MKHILLLLLIGFVTNSYSQNQAPVAVDDTIYYKYGEIHEFDSVRILPTFLENDSDVDGNHLILHDIIYSGPNSLVVFKPGSSVRWLTYLTNSTYTGTETFQYIIRDNGTPVMYDTGMVTIVLSERIMLFLMQII